LIQGVQTPQHRGSKTKGCGSAEDVQLHLFLSCGGNCRLFPRWGTGPSARSGRSRRSQQKSDSTQDQHGFLHGTPLFFGWGEVLTGSVAPVEKLLHGVVNDLQNLFSGTGIAKPVWLRPEMTLHCP
jgi:hypothetical protein